MALVIGVPIKLGRVAYKAYKKHQAEKHAQEHGMPHTLVDPSHELEHGFNAHNSSSHQQVPVVYRTEYDSNDDESHVGVNMHYSPAEQAEIDRALEHDEDFQRFMRDQKHLYLNEHRGPRHSSRNLSPGPERSVHVNQPLDRPPAYDAPIYNAPPRMDPNSRGIENSNRATQRGPFDTEEESISPASPSSVYSERYTHESNDVLISPIIPPRSSFRSVSELPGSSRMAVEMPTTRS